MDKQVIVKVIFKKIQVQSDGKWGVYVLSQKETDAIHLKPYKTLFQKDGLTEAESDKLLKEQIEIYD